MSARESLHSAIAAGRNRWRKAGTRLGQSIASLSTRLSLLAMGGIAMLPALPPKAPPSQLATATADAPVNPLLINSRHVKVSRQPPAPAPAPDASQHLLPDAIPSGPPKLQDARELPLPPAKAPTEQQAEPDVWPASEIEVARAECRQLLASVSAEFDQQEPFRNGPCGTPAPISLKSMTPAKVALSPPATVNCRMAKALNDWIQSTLQPAAREAFGQPVSRIVTASSYTCRNRYGLASAPISEHAFANAVDISGFVLADGRTVKVLTGWGPVARDTAKTPPPSTKGAATGAITPLQTAGMRTAGLKAAPSGKPAAPALKPATNGETATATAMEGEFLRRIHGGACARFGTVLGPEANDAHRDHMHFDLKARNHGALCE